MTSRTVVSKIVATNYILLLPIKLIKVKQNVKLGSSVTVATF